MSQEKTLRQSDTAKWKRAIVNFAQFVRYLADRVSIKLTQFTMKNVSAREHFESAELFLCLCRDRRNGERIEGSPQGVRALALPQCPTLCISRGNGCSFWVLKKRRFKNVTAHSTQSPREKLNQRANLL